MAQKKNAHWTEKEWKEKKKMKNISDEHTLLKMYSFIKYFIIHNLITRNNQHFNLTRLNEFDSISSADSTTQTYPENSQDF